MAPSVYLYNEKESEFELYFGDFSTIAGLNAINENLNVKVSNISALNFEKNDWASEKELPIWNTVKEVKSFFNNTKEFNLIDFEIELIGFGNLSTHDDGECHFRFKKKNDLLGVLNNVVNHPNKKIIISEIISNPGIYYEIKKSGEMIKYHSFDHYLNKTHNNV